MSICPVTSGPPDISVTPGMLLLFGHFGTSRLTVRCLIICLGKKVKQFLYWPGRALRFREV